MKPDEKEGWIIDLQDLESKITKETKAILVNNPSNPCGSCFSKQHLLDVIAIADKHKVPIIADEVYHGLSYEEERPFVSMGHLTKDVPILATGSISKIYLLPGWRCGWVICYNNHGYFDKVLDNLGKHAMIQLHPTSLVQAALPQILDTVPESFFENLKGKLREASTYAYERVGKIKGITPVKAQAAMYLFCMFDPEVFEGISDDIDFCKKLLADQNCMIFPAQCFFSKNGFRLTICTSKEVIDDFATRLEAFCQKHYK